MQERVTVEEASAVLGIPPTRIRNRLRRDYIKKTHDFPVGHAHRAETGKSFRYELYKTMIMKYMGLDKWPEEKKEGESHENNL